MSISDKLTAVAENIPVVYAAGAAAGRTAAEADADAQIAALLIEAHGAREAFKKFAEIYAGGGSLTEISNRFFTAAAKSADDTHASEFYRYSVNPTPAGTKLDGNAGLVCVPSTNILAARDDYADLPLFACFDCNYTIDADTLEPVIHAVKDIAGDFTGAPADSMVGVMQMTGWVRRTATDTTKKVEYRAKPSEGFKPLPEAVRARDNSVRPFVIHAKYAAGFNAAGRLSSVSGVQPATRRPGSAGSAQISHDGQISLWREWGNQYCGASLCDIAFVQLMLEIKYATLGSAQVMSGCRSYSAAYTAAVAETGVTRVLLTAAQAAYFAAGRCVSLGASKDRNQTACYDVCDITKILSIEDVTVDGTAYKAVNLDAETPFNTTTATYIVAQPWQTGSTNGVLGNDGSPTDNISGKEPCKIQGIEIMLGMYEVTADTTLYGDAEKYAVYLNRKAADIQAGNSGANRYRVGTIPKETDAGSKCVAELNWEANDQEAYMLAQSFASSATTGYCADFSRDGAATTSWREWLALGGLDSWGDGGFACVSLRNNLGIDYWRVAARACGSGGNRGEYGT